MFRAERTSGGVRQEVALKLLDRPLYTSDAQRQFRREHLALTHLRHPGIARLIEGGITDAGHAYIALELVDGTPITLHAWDRHLELRSRLQLFLFVCRAVEAAHRALIVHRDLKPANVLVTTEGEVKLLDFGIAKLLSDEDETQTRLPVFTPAYAAPEQRDGGAITTATDVYALGVLLGELITGERLNDGSGRTPSSQIDARHAPGVLPATVKAMRRQLRGDLDNILLKAIDPEPEHRYVSAGALADDIERLLGGLPVAAHPPSTWYRARKFATRHKGGVATTVAFLLAIFAALGIALWQANVARREAQRAKAVRDFVIQIFDAAKAALPTDARPTPEMLVQQAAKRLHNDPAIDADLRSDLLVTLGKVSRTTGDYAGAEALLDEVIKQQDTAGLPASDPERLEPIVRKAEVLQLTNRNEQADQLLQGILPALRREQTETAVDGLMLYALARLYAGHADESLAVAQEAAAKAATVLPANSLDAIKCETFPGDLAVNIGFYDKGIEILEPAIARWRALPGERDIDFAQALLSLAVAKSRSDLAGAEAAYRESIALRRRIYADHPNDRLASGIESFAIFLGREEHFDEAHALLEEALAIYRQVLGAENLSVASALDSLGMTEIAQRHFADAETHLRDAISIYAAHVDRAGHADDAALTQVHLAQVLMQRERLDEAAKLDGAAIDALEQLSANGGSPNHLLGARILGGRIALASGDANAALTQSERIAAQIDSAKTVAPGVREATICCAHWLWPRNSSTPMLWPRRSLRSTRVVPPATVPRSWLRCLPCARVNSRPWARPKMLQPASPRRARSALRNRCCRLRMSRPFARA